MVEVIKRVIPEGEKEYHADCGYCKATLRFKMKEAEKKETSRFELYYEIT